MTTREYKRNARMVLNGNYMPFVLSRLMFMIVTWLITVFSGNIISIGIGFGENIAITSGVVILSLITDIFMLFVGYLFTFGYTKMGLRLNRGQRIDIRMALDGFRAESKPWKMVGLSFVNALISFIIMFVPIVMFIVGTFISGLRNEFSGILNFASGLMIVCSFIVAYVNFGLALSVYIIIDHPEISIFSAMKGSFRMMKRRRFKLIWLSIFSFFGWHLLNMMTAGVLSIWLEPYIMSSVIQFYMDINGESFVYADMNRYQSYQQMNAYNTMPENENSRAAYNEESTEAYKKGNFTEAVSEVKENTEADVIHTDNQENENQSYLPLLNLEKHEMNSSENEATEVKISEAETASEEKASKEENASTEEMTQEVNAAEAAKTKTFEELMEELYKENKLKEDNYFGKGDRS